MGGGESVVSIQWAVFSIQYSVVSGEWLNFGSLWEVFRERLRLQMVVLRETRAMRTLPKFGVVIRF